VVDIVTKHLLTNTIGFNIDDPDETPLATRAYRDDHYFLFLLAEIRKFEAQLERRVPGAN